MSAKSNKFELSEEFMVMWKEEQPMEVFCKKGIPRNFSNFTGKPLCQSLFCKYSRRSRESSKNTFSYRTPLGDCFQSLKRMSGNFQSFSDQYF